MAILLKNGYVVDPMNSFQGKTDILVKNGMIFDLGEDLACDGAEVIDCEGLTIIPGLCDMHVHLRDPGQMVYLL